MPSLSWSLSVQVSGGPTITVPRPPRPVEAFDIVHVEVGPGAADEEVEIQPGAAESLTMLLVKSSFYDSELTFKASDGSSDSDAVALDEPQVFAGGAIALFGVDPKVLKFSNATTDRTAVVEVFVFRRATS